jgi:hypothetical protein
LVLNLPGEVSGAARFVPGPISVASATMSDREPENGHSTRLLRALIWSGIGLATVAALVVLVGGDGPERFAVLLVTVCVVLLGASLLIRNDPVLLRMHVEDRLADQVGALREELRGEVAAATARVAATPSAGAPGRKSAVGAAPAGSPSAGPASVGSASVGPVSVGSTSMGSARVAAPDIGWARLAQPDVGSARVAPPDAGSASIGSASVGPPAVGSVRAGSASGGPASGSSDARGATASAAGAAAVPGRRVASAPGWPDPRPAPRTFDPGSLGAHSPVGAAGPSVGAANPSVGAASVPEPPIAAAQARTDHQVGGVAVPGQRGHRTAGVGTPMAPVRPQPASAEPYGSTSRRTGEVGSGHVVKSRHEERVYGRRPAEGEQSGRRRADVTAVDIGYTGRRVKGDHAADEDCPSHGGGPDLDGEFGYGDPRRSGSEYRGSSYGRRATSRKGYGDADGPDPAGDPGRSYPASRYGSYGESGFGDPEPGYPGWAEAKERYGSNLRGHDRTAGW